jgi:hypothetical protein
MTPREKADHAQQVLNDPVMNEAFAAIRIGMLERLESIPISDHETQHEITLMLQLLKQVRTQLQTFVDDMAIEKKRQENEDYIARLKQRAKAFMG